MSLRITGGELRGRIVESPDGMSTRPTTDMWRQTIYAALEHLIDLEGATVCDLYAGTGILGFEALSRGAASLQSVEHQRKRAAALKQTAQDLGVADRITVFEDTVESALPRLQGKCDLILADPPYDLRAANALISAIAEHHLLKPGGILVVEHGPMEFVLPLDGWATMWSKEKGDTVVDMLQWQPPAS